MLLMKHPLMNRVSTLSLYANGIYFIHVFFLMLFKFLVVFVGLGEV